ncbi:hypothetical protein [Alcaligenes faecalis]|uniref:hypothetical protein n=1 Tax=Alcaligenes faecalis TaxID=511 RepID=UPI002932FF50|nr:hypothetical protein [Alcaligenes faecalis]MDV2116471.1 hypothetical protein [Alcaligenes faecalis]
MSRFKRNRSDGSRFLLMPFTVLESQAYLSLTGQQTRLLIDIAHQYRGDNNGRLLAAWTYLNEERGWTSKQTIATALEVLLSRGLLFKTRQGQRPNKTSWYALTWQPLDHHPDMDVGPQSLERAAYKDWRPEKAQQKQTPD